MVSVVWESTLDDRHVIKVDSKEDFEKNKWGNGYNINHDDNNNYYGILTVDWDGSLPAYYAVAGFDGNEWCWTEHDQITDVKEWCEQMIAGYDHVADSLYKFSKGVR